MNQTSQILVDFFTGGFSISAPAVDATLQPMGRRLSDLEASYLDMGPEIGLEEWRHDSGAWERIGGVET